MNKYWLSMPCLQSKMDDFKKLDQYRYSISGVGCDGFPENGKSYFIIQHISKQQIQKGFGTLVHTLKFYYLTKHVYNHDLKYQQLYAVKSKFYIIHFYQISRAVIPFIRR